MAIFKSPNPWSYDEMEIYFHLDKETVDYLLSQGLSIEAIKQYARDLAQATIH